VSFELPEFTADATAVGALCMLELLRMTGPNARSYQASSSEMSGSASLPQNEQTLFHPRSPCGLSKVFAYWTSVNYREAYGIFAGDGILFNHENERRGETFVTRKISLSPSTRRTIGRAAPSVYTTGSAATSEVLAQSRQHE
jgi:GDPmannose 4,6-dehydratase